MEARDAFVLLYLCGIVGCRAQGIKAIVDIVQPDTSSGNVTLCRLQDFIVVSVQTGSDQLTLNLQRNSAVKENTPVYVVRHIGNNTVTVRDTVLDTEGWQEYLDIANMASVEVSCRITSDDKPRYLLRGFLSLPGGTLYEMTHYNGAPEEAQGPGDDVLYTLKPVKPLIDKQTIDITLPYDEADGVSEQKETWWTHESRRKRSTDEIHVDVVAVVDHSVYQRWFTRISQESEALTHAETKENIRRHFAHLVNGVDLRFKTASTLYNIHLVGYVIEDQGRGEWFQSVLNEEDNPNNTKIDASKLLPSARDWKRSTQGFPENDHVIVFTAYDLYRTVANGIKDLLGYAYVGTICERPGYSISLVEYTDNLVDDLLVTAHEMGHGLSARHDGEYNNTCSGADAYIMSSSYSSYHNVSITNYFLFSNCSISYFQTFLDQVLATGDARSRNCLLESLEPTSVTNVSGEWPGQLYSVNEQCQMKFGPTSYMCLGTGSTVSVCKRLYCALPDRPGRCRSINAMDGTTCGNRQWCVSGQCLSSVDAPEQNLACPYGDQISHQNMSCPELVSPASKHLCYNDFYSVFICCDTCRSHRRNNSENCSYGDRIATCATDIPPERKYLCYSERNFNLCCETCTSYKGNEENCSYGDRIATCATDIPPERKYLCYSERNFNLCCETCTSYKGNGGCEYGDRNRMCSRERCDPSDITYINYCCATCSSPTITTSTLTSTSTSATSTPTPTTTSTTSTPTQTSTSTSTASTPTVSTPASTTTSTTSTSTSTPTTSTLTRTSTSSTSTVTSTPTPATSTIAPTSTSITPTPPPTSTTTTPTITSTSTHTPPSAYSTPTPTSTPTTSTPTTTSTSTHTPTPAYSTPTPTSTSTTSTPTTSTSTHSPTSAYSTPTPTSTSTYATPEPTSTSSTATTTSTPTIPSATSTFTTSTPASSTTSTSTTSVSTITSTTSSSVPISTAYTTSLSTTTPVKETSTSTSGLATQGMRVGGFALLLSLLVISLWENR